MPKKQDRTKAESTADVGYVDSKPDDKQDEKDYSKLVEQVEKEYQLAYKFIKPKWDKWQIRLKLYNNQKRDAEAVGDPLLFTIHQTILASLYEDRLSVEFEPRERGDMEVAENLNNLALYDYADMGKDEIDYDWDWDTLFFGRGLLLFSDFDRDLKVPVPEVIDPMTFLRDPNAVSVNGRGPRRTGSARFFGRQVRMTKDEMKETKGFFNLKNLKNKNSRSEIDDNVAARQIAQGYDDTKIFGQLQGDNADYAILQWFTMWQGKKIVVFLAEERKRVIKIVELKDKLWPVIDRSLYAMAHDWDGVSIPDLVEDKQRHRAIGINLGMKVAKAALYPTYLYDMDKIKNQNELTLDFNKFIGVEGDPGNAIKEVPRAQVRQDVAWIMDLLDTSAQKATATPDVQQGAATRQKRTATEIGLVAQKVDTRYSLSAKIFGWSERRFWQQWYALYKRHFKDGIDEKVLRISGTFGPDWRDLTRENVIANVDPDVKIESKVVSEARRMNELQIFGNLAQALTQDPTSNKRTILKYQAKLSGLKQDVINAMLPKTYDEMEAEEENKELDKNKIAEILVTDDDVVHLEIHNKAADTPAKQAHIKAHVKAMRLKRLNPAFANPTQNEQATVAGVQQPNMNYEDQTPAGFQAQ